MELLLKEAATELMPPRNEDCKKNCRCRSRVKFESPRETSTAARRLLLERRNLSTGGDFDSDIRARIQACGFHRRDDELESPNVEIVPDRSSESTVVRMQLPRCGETRQPSTSRDSRPQDALSQNAKTLTILGVTTRNPQTKQRRG